MDSSNATTSAGRLPARSRSCEGFGESLAVFLGSFVADAMATWDERKVFWLQFQVRMNPFYVSHSLSGCKPLGK